MYNVLRLRLRAVEQPVQADARADPEAEGHVRLVRRARRARRLRRTGPPVSHHSRLDPRAFTSLLASPLLSSSVPPHVLNCAPVPVRASTHSR